MPDAHFFAGVGAGVLTSLLLHPLDLIKVRFQVQDGVLHANRYKSIADAVRLIWREEGARGFYRGVVPGAWGSGASWGLYFFFYEAIKRRMASPGPDGRSLPLSTGQHMGAAVAGGAATCLFTNPLWLVKTRMQTAGPAVPGQPGASVAGMWSTLTTIARTEGVPGLYRGLLPALLLTSHGAIQFGLYEWLKRHHEDMPWAAWDRQGTTASPGQPPISSSALFAYGAVSKAAAVLGTYPYQVIKARLQQSVPTASAGADTPRPYTGLVDTASRMLKHEGGRSFYKGFTANLLRVAPQSAVTLTSYEWIKAALQSLEHSKDGGR